MGSVRMGPPAGLVERLQQAGGLTRFVETGTYEGHTAYWAAERFERVLTIEYSMQMHAAAVSRWQETTNIEFVYGDSRQVLHQRVPQFDTPALFWLDAHWSGGATYGAGDECPLLAELNTICCAEAAHYILIDDARLFVSPPPPPHVPEQWPSMADIAAVLASASHDFRAAVVDDVIVAVPPSAADLLADYGRRSAAEYQPLVLTRATEAV